jgi:four helix bundle protein
MAYQKYTDLEVWKKSKNFASTIYKISASFPKDEIYGLTSQIRRCAVSVPSNIAEGSGRQYSKDTIQFLAIARGSLYEMETQLFISCDLGYISLIQLNESLTEIENIGKLLNGYIRFLKGHPKNLKN